MADVEKIQERIRELAGRRKNVKLTEIQWVISQLGQNGYDTASRDNGHQMLFRVGPVRFGVCSHNPGSSQIKACYVDGFVDAMIEIGLYED